jgi:hypothetical protein
VLRRPVESADEKQTSETGVEQKPSPPHRKGQFVPGVSGNPAGRRTQKQRIDARFAILASEFKDPTGTEVLMLRHAARLLIKAEATKDGDVSVRAVNSVRRLLNGLRQQRREGAPPAPRWSPLLSRLAAGEPKEPAQ